MSTHGNYGSRVTLVCVGSDWMLHPMLALQGSTHDVPNFTFDIAAIVMAATVAVDDTINIKLLVARFIRCLTTIAPNKLTLVI